VSARTIRFAAVLLPAALLLHEGAFALSGGGLLTAHSYLHVAVPVAIAIAASLALAALLLPALRPDRGGPIREEAPLWIAGALVAIFVVQELTEALVLGGGASGLAASLAASWSLLPLALAIGLVGAHVLELLDRSGRRIAALLASPPQRYARSAAPVVRSTGRRTTRPLLPTGLSFGFARRPPPAVRSTPA